MAGTAFAEGQLVAVRSACAEEMGHPVDWDDPTSYRDGLEEKYEAPSEPWTVGGVLAGVGRMVGALAFLAIWVNGVVAPLRLTQVTRAGEERSSRFPTFWWDRPELP